MSTLLKIWENTKNLLPKNFLSPGMVIDETMSGWIVFEKAFADFPLNEQLPFKISLRAFTTDILNLNALRKFKGQISLTGFFQNLPAEGDMQISTRGVAYTIHTQLPDGKKFIIQGKKVYRLEDLIYTLTTCPMTVMDEGQVTLGKAELVYRDPLWMFPFGVSVITDHEGAWRTNYQRARKLAALAPILTPDIEDILSAEELIKAIEQQLEGKPILILKYVELLSHLVSSYSLLKFRCRMGKLNRAQRLELANALGKISIYHFLALPLVDLVLTAAYGHKKYLENKGANIPVKPKENEPERWMELNFTPRVQYSKQPYEVEAVVIGSGAGGAAIAYELSKRGHAVAIIEEGHYFKRKDFSGNRAEMQLKLYHKGGYQFPLSNSPIWLPTGKCVGGTTTINSGTCIRLPKEVSQRWQNELGIDVDLAPYYAEVERMLNVTEVPEKLLGGIAKVMRKGLEGTDFKFEPLRRAESGCDGQSYCIIGCPTGAKRSTDVSFVPESLKQNAFLFSNYQLKEILRQGDRVTGIRAGLEGHGDEFDITIRANAVIISAGTLRSPSILFKDFLGRKDRKPTDLPQLGKNLSIHPALCLGALFKEKVREKFFVPQSSGVFNLEDSKFILEGYTLPVDGIPHAFGTLGLHLKEIMEKIDYFTNFASMLVDSSSGSLLFSPSGESYPSYFLNQETVQSLQKSAWLMTDIFLKAGATKIYTPIHGHERLTGEVDAESLKSAKLKPWHFKLSAHHPLGTCRMGSSIENSVVDANGKVWGEENLFVVDGSIIPGPLGVNPQVTIMSNALRIGEHLSTKVL